MMNRYLLPVYSEVFGTGFSYSNFNDRLKMQKMVYLLQELGMPLGAYRFYWYKHGPYSQSLLDDMYSLVCDDSSFSLSSDCENDISKLRDILADNHGYTTEQWIECLASLHYLKNNILPRKASEDEVLQELIRRKGHLSDMSSNRSAYHYIETLFQ